jgi:MFS family permease
MQQGFQPYTTLVNRTFIGLIIAQFLAAFNDQCIHAAAMFYAIRTNTLTEASAISLMPILFYAPWAIFCTLAGYLADRHSKKYTLVFWKFAEVAIALLALVGFWLGNTWKTPVGPWIVLSAVFLMGMHSAFFVPAKYGVMPEILPHSLLSKGNGVLESTSFLAVILGTVAGGMLSDRRLFKGQEEYIGLILLALAVAGALASLMIRKMPAANPDRPFPGLWPHKLYGPLWHNIKILIRSRPLALSVIGIAFFTFIVAFMRGTMYLHGETRSPRWDEFHISVIVGTVALGIGLGSPLAGWLSGRKVELGLVPLGALGMATAMFAASFFLDWQPGLIACIIALGFCVGFYFVPLYSLLQHRAPKSSKGDVIATSNFINVTGAIVASVCFFSLIWAVHKLRLTPEIEQRDNLYVGTLVSPIEYRNGRPAYFEIRLDGEPPRLLGFGESSRIEPPEPRRLGEEGSTPEPIETTRVHVDQDELLVVSRLEPGRRVVVSSFVMNLEGHPVVHYVLRPEGTRLTPVYDNRGLPRFLFIGGSIMTLLMLLMLCRMLPDFFVRSILWLRAIGRYRIRVFGIHNLPAEGAAILATNCERFTESMHVVSCTDRRVRFILQENLPPEEQTPLLRFLAQNTGMILLPARSLQRSDIKKAIHAAQETLTQGDVVALTVDEDHQLFGELLSQLKDRSHAGIVPVYCHTLPDPQRPEDPKRVWVLIGEPLAGDSSPEEAVEALRRLKEKVFDGSLSQEEPLSAVHPAA